MENVTQEHIFSFSQKPNSFSVLMQDAILELEQGHNNIQSKLDTGDAFPTQGEVVLCNCISKDFIFQSTEH